MMELLEKFPLPWTCETDERISAIETEVGVRFAGGYTVKDANGKIVMDGGSYSGSVAAQFNPNRHQVKELVEILNKVVKTY